MDLCTDDDNSFGRFQEDIDKGRTDGLANRVSYALASQPN